MGIPYIRQGINVNSVDNIVGNKKFEYFSEYN